MWAKDVKGYYAIRHGPKVDGKWTVILMHREILGLERGDPRKGDHKNPAETLNNTDDNLRITDCSGQQRNQRIQANNTSGYKGVTLDKARRKWSSSITVNYKSLHLGRYKDKVDAARAYDKAAIKHFGKFAWLNFPRTDYDEIIEVTVAA
jgi:hypothetical protein